MLILLSWVFLDFDVFCLYYNLNDIRETLRLGEGEAREDVSREAPREM